MKRRYTIVGGLAAFVAFGFWLAGRNPKAPNLPADTSWRRVHYGAIDAPQKVAHCTKSAIVKIGYNKYVWRCTAADTLLEGNLYFTFYDNDTERQICILMVGMDGRDVYGARYHDIGDSLQIQAVDRVVIP